jgi:hypothetical protein
LLGFDAAFLSYGNFGPALTFGASFTPQMMQTITEYLSQAGRLYIECGSFFTMQDYLGYPNVDELMELFGIEESQFPSYNNHISLLTGLENSICTDLQFNGSLQNMNWFINAMTPNDNGIAAFEEDNYGIVAIQGEGEYGQKTFIFSYAIAHLIDNENSNREALLQSLLKLNLS